MPKAVYKLPEIKNEPVTSYAPGTREREALKGPYRHEFNAVTMKEELFGPILTVYVYDPEEFEETLDILDSTTDYALTGAIFSTDRPRIEKLTARLTHTAGNFYINDKPTGAVVDQQPFGGGRASGTNDKAGSVFNLLRWVSPQCIKETFVPPADYMYPNFMEE